MLVHVTCGACEMTYDQEVEVHTGLPLVPCCGACGSGNIDVAKADPRMDNLTTEEKRQRLINLLRLIDPNEPTTAIEGFDAAQVASGYRQVIFASQAAKQAHPDSATGAWGDIDRP